MRIKAASTVRTSEFSDPLKLCVNPWRPHPQHGHVGKRQRNFLNLNQSAPMPNPNTICFYIVPEQCHIGDGTFSPMHPCRIRSSYSVFHPRTSDNQAPPEQAARGGCCPGMRGSCRSAKLGSDGQSTTSHCIISVLTTPSAPFKTEVRGTSEDTSEGRTGDRGARNCVRNGILIRSFPGDWSPSR